MSYEEKIKEKITTGDDLPKKLEISVLRYFWQSNPVINKKSDSIPRFLRKIDVLKNFSENELRILSRHLHLRRFSPGEVVFKQSDLGVGFYLIFSGYTDIIVEANSLENESQDKGTKHVLTLEKFDTFGELALLQDNSVRNASAISRQGCELLGIFKPDVEEMINSYPLVAAKLLQSVSLIVANRLFSLTREVQQLKFKLSAAEKGKNA
ncbi:MAG: cyclic nucleotide-binding domain-containing protein [Halobacteriovoraceae bacterium]|nr:cyclic nucleotide-binding domain-containing protein [Halobacteriovoraceae bacterium]